MNEHARVLFRFVVALSGTEVVRGLVEVSVSHDAVVCGRVTLQKREICNCVKCND